MCWLVLATLGCAPTMQDYEADTIDDLDAGTDAEGSLDLSEKATSVTYQAETSTTASGCVVARDRAGYTGSGFIDFGGQGTFLEWNNVRVSAAGDYSISVRYANASAGNRPGDVIVNGAKIGSISFAPTGRWTNWNTASIKATLRSGSNRIRIVASTSAGGPNIDSMNVSDGSSGSGSSDPSGSGTVRDLEFVHFANLPRSRQRTTFTNVTANYIVYDESNGRDGHNDIRKDQPGFVGMSGATLVGYGGGRDKYIALFKVTSKTVIIDLDQGQDDSDGGAGHALFIKTARTLTVAEARSIDPALRSEDVPGPRSSGEVVIYAEDEGGKADRDARFKPLAHRYFASGDDLVYVFARSLGDTPNGNGAIMRLRIQ
jgi:hypothetical protein